MAIYRLEAKILGRQARDLSGKAIPGQQVSAVAKAAYRSGERLHDERIDKSFDYRSRTQEVAYHAILAPEEAPAWLQAPESREKRERLWNEVERAEKRKDSQLAREFIISLPKELGRASQIETVTGWCRQELVSKGFVVDVAIHGADSPNPHAHVLCTLRPMEASGFGLKPSTAGKFNGRGDVGHGAKSELELWRESWAAAENRALEAAGSDARVDHRSLADQGIDDRLPEPKMGVAAVHMQRTGKVFDPERVRAARRVRVLNMVMPAIREIEHGGEVRQEGAGPNWRERAAAALGRFYDGVREFARDESSGSQRWRNYVREREEREIDRDSPG